jgi:hypothetical protein
METTSQDLAGGGARHDSNGAIGGEEENLGVGVGVGVGVRVAGAKNGHVEGEG